MNQVLRSPRKPLGEIPATRYHQLRRKRRIMKSLAEVIRLASDLNARLAAHDDGVPDAMVDHLSTATLSLGACRLLVERHGGGDNAT